MTTKDLFTYMEMQVGYFPAKMKSTLSNRIVKPGYVETIPPPQNLIIPLANWNTDANLSHYVPHSPPTTGGTPYWRRDGSCGFYTSGADPSLIQQNIPTGFCEKHYPTEECRTAGRSCRRVLQSDRTDVMSGYGPDCP